MKVLTLKLPTRISLQVVLLLLFLAALVGSGVLFYFYNQSQAELKKLKETPQVLAREETEKLLAEVGTLMRLPQNEEPTVATVTDAKKLQNQAFFQDARNGDKVLFYAQARKAILYRPGSKLIIEVARVSGDQTQSIRIALYNGASASTALTSFEQLLQQKVTKVEVVKRQNAQRRNYTGILVVDLSGEKSQAASELAGVLGGSVGSLPSGEIRPSDADFLIIVGNSVPTQPTRR